MTPGLANPTPQPLPGAASAQVKKATVKASENIKMPQVGQMHQFAKLPALGSQPKAAPIQQEIMMDAQPQETLEERKLRLEARRDALLKKKKEEEETKQQEQQQQESTMRRTWQKINESAAEKKARIARCMKVLKDTDTGKPIDINWMDEAEEEDEDDSWKDQEGQVEI